MRRKFSVQLLPVKYSSRYFSLRTVMLFLFGLSALLGNAQEGSAVVADTTITEVLTEDGEQDAEEDRPDYFLKRWYYDTDSVRVRQLPDSLLAVWKKDKAFWYADSVFRNMENRQSPEMVMPPPQRADSNSRRVRVSEPEREYNSTTNQPWLQTLLLVIIIGGFAGFILYYLFSNKGMFKSNKKLATEEMPEAETEDIFAINYQKEIDKAAAAGNYRFAIRLMFLRVLKNMAEKNIIQYKQDRTNLDYLMQLSSTSYYNDFFRITRNYEYSWYGHFEVDAEKYRVIKNDFENFKPGFTQA
jgi:hypothetical protein